MTKSMEECADGWNHIEAIAKAIISGVEIKLDEAVEVDRTDGYEEKQKRKYGGDPSPTLTTVSDGSNFNVVYQVPGYDPKQYGNLSVFTYGDGPMSVDQFIKDTITQWGYTRAFDYGTILAFSLQGTDNVFIYKIGQRGALKGAPIFVSASGTPQVEKSRTRMPSPERVRMTSEDSYSIAWSESPTANSWYKWKSAGDVFYKDKTVQEFAEYILEREGYTRLKVKTSVGEYLFKAGKHGKTLGKAFHIRENPSY